MPPKQECPMHGSLELLLKTMGSNISSIKEGVDKINGRVRNTETEQATQKQRLNGHDKDIGGISHKLGKQMSPGKAISIGVTVIMAFLGILTWIMK